MNKSQASREMDEIKRIGLFLLCTWCLDQKRVMIAGAQPTVAAMIVTPETDRKEGGSIDMKCVAINLTSNHTVEWRTEEPQMILRFGTQTFWTDSRFMFETLMTENEYIQEIVIDPLLRNDTDEYICNVIDLTINTGNRVVATDRVKLSVLYFPNEPFPICSPDESIRVDAGTEFNMQCSTEAGNSAVRITVNDTSSRYDANLSDFVATDDTLSVSLNLTVCATDVNTTFECTISSKYYPNMTQACFIGPINVVGAIKSHATSCITTTPSDSNQTMMDPVATTPTPSFSHTAIIAGASAGGVAAFVLLLALVVISRKCGFLSANSTPAKHDTDSKSMPSISQQASDVATRRNDGFGASVNPDAAPVTGPRCCTDSGNSGIEIRTPIKETSHDDSTKLRVTPPSTAAETRYQSFDATQQKYSNPVFDSTDPDSTSEPSGLTPITALKPIAKVSPTVKVPKKPEPYKPKAQRASKHNEVTDDLQERRSQTLTPPPTSPLATPNNDEVSYAQISVPSKQEQNRPCQEPFLNQPLSDNMVYADLDLK